jgi:hypothetical protein
LLGLIIGFTFSMAVTRYDQRKSDEAAEANAIGTEFARAGLLAPSEAAKVRVLLRSYLAQRVLFYTTRHFGRLRQIDDATVRTQHELWAVVETNASSLPPPIAVLLLSGMNDVLNSQAHTQAAWWNRIPIPAWVLMGAIAVCCSVLFGYTERRPEGHPVQLLLLPLIVSISFFLIADLDSPRGGVIHLHPQNLEALARSLAPPDAPPLP